MSISQHFETFQNVSEHSTTFFKTFHNICRIETTQQQKSQASVLHVPRNRMRKAIMFRKCCFCGSFFCYMLLITAPASASASALNHGAVRGRSRETTGSYKDCDRGW